MYDAHVIFEDSPAWWSRPFKKNFRHVSVLIPLKGRWCVHVDPRCAGVGFTLVKPDELDYMYDRALYHDITIVRYRVTEEIRGHVPSVFTCVELVKRALGIRAWWVLTPSQLYRHIIKLKRREVCLTSKH